MDDSAAAAGAIHTHYAHTLCTHAMHTPYPHTLSTHPIPYQHTLSTHIDQSIASTYPMNTTFDHITPPLISSHHAVFPSPHLTSPHFNLPCRWRNVRMW